MESNPARVVYIQLHPKGILISYRRPYLSSGVTGRDPLLFTKKIDPLSLGQGIKESLEINPEPCTQDEVFRIRKGLVPSVPRNRPEVTVKKSGALAGAEMNLFEDGSVLVRIFPKRTIKMHEELQKRKLPQPVEGFSYSIPDVETLGRDCLAWLEKAKNWPDPLAGL